MEIQTFKVNDKVFAEDGRIQEREVLSGDWSSLQEFQAVLESSSRGLQDISVSIGDGRWVELGVIITGFRDVRADEVPALSFTIQQHLRTWEDQLSTAERTFFSNLLNGFEVFSI